MENVNKIQCPCGTFIEDPGDYKVLYLKHEMREIDILCPNDACYLRELGYVKFDMEGEKAKFKEASFYPPFVTWNSGRLGFETADKILKEHLKAIVKNIDWERIGKATESESESQ